MLVSDSDVRTDSCIVYSMCTLYSSFIGQVLTLGCYCCSLACIYRITHAVPVPGANRTTPGNLVGMMVSDGAQQY